MTIDLTPKPDDPLYSRQQAADYLGLAYQTLAEWSCTSKNLPVVKFGRKVYYRKSDLDDYIQRSVVPASA